MFFSKTSFKDELASAARSIFNPTEEQARYFKAADTCVQLEDLTHQVSIETIALHMFPEEWRTLPGKIYYTLEVVAPHKTGRHKYNTRRRVVRHLFFGPLFDWIMT